MDLRDTVRQRKLLLVAATGGHLTELIRLAQRLGASKDSVWVTFDTAQSRSMLKGQNTFFVPYVSPRDWRGTLRAFRLIAKFLKSRKFDAVYSTGAAVALAAFLQPALLNVPKAYIESVSRTTGPSLTGRLVGFLPSVLLFTQHSEWANNRWKKVDSVLDHYETKNATDTDVAPSRLFVTLGTIRPYRFDSLIDAVLKSGLAGDDTVWQVGATDRTDLPGTIHEQMNADEFIEVATAADVIVTHAGVGTVIQLFELGKSPVVVPREKSRDEHVDDHQFQIVKLLEKRGLAVVSRSHEISADHIVKAMNQRTEIHEYR